MNPFYQILMFKIKSKVFFSVTLWHAPLWHVWKTLRLCVRVMYILCFYLVLIVDNASKKCSKQNTSGNFAYNLVTNQAFSCKTYNFGRGEAPFQVPWVSVGLKMTRSRFMFIQDFKCRIYTWIFKKFWNSHFPTFYPIPTWVLICYISFIGSFL